MSYACAEQSACQQRVCAHGATRIMTPRSASLFTLLLLSTTFPSTTPQSQNNSQHLHLFGWRLELEPNFDIQSPSYQECKYYKGRVLHESNSRATVTKCDDSWYGLLQVNDELIVLPPSSEDHNIRRRDALLARMLQKIPYYNVTNDTDFEEIDKPKASSRIHTRSITTSQQNQFRTDAEPSVSKRLWLEVAIVADHTMVQFHGDKLKHYILAVMNIVSAIFNDRSLGANMTLVIRKLFLLGEHEPIVKYGNISDTLHRVIKWNKKHLLRIADESSRWDALIWLTRSELGGPSGLAQMNSVCSLNSSTVQRDEGFTSAFVISHELGHLLGLHHDDKTFCSSKPKQSTIMAPIVRASLDFAWSPCSRKQFHLKARKWKCLHERSGQDGLELDGEPNRHKDSQAFSLDHQCRVEFGNGFTKCEMKMDAAPCATLYCAHETNANTCYSKNAPPLEGSSCGTNRWCKGGECKPMSTISSTHESVTDEGDSWKIGKCSADCGYGFRVSRKPCRKGLANTTCHSGRNIISTCWSGQPCPTVRDIRADLCRRIHPEYIPFVHNEKLLQCTLSCVNYKGGESAVFDSLPDGASCSYEKPYDLCFRGSCLEGQCDESDPICNFCAKGQCKNYTRNGVRHLRKGWMPILKIPKEAHRFSAYISTPVPLYVGARAQSFHDVIKLDSHSETTKTTVQFNDYFKYETSDPDSLRILEIDNNIRDSEDNRLRLEGRLVLSSAVLSWKISDTDVYIEINTPPEYDITILVTPELPDYADEEIKFIANFSTPYTSAFIRPQENRRRERGPCSVSCGGGVRVIRQRCFHHTCRPLLYESCNMQPCEFTWIYGEWEECSQTCGTSGVQERQAFCVPANARLNSHEDIMKHIVSPLACQSKIPKKEQECNRIPCPVYWEEMPWTPCSATCGPGHQYQDWWCPSPRQVECGARPPPRRRRCRLRRCPPRPPADLSHTCALLDPQFINHYCGILSFKKLCNKTCRDAQS